MTCIERMAGNNGYWRSCDKVIVYQFDSRSLKIRYQHKYHSTFAFCAFSPILLQICQCQECRIESTKQEMDFRKDAARVFDFVQYREARVAENVRLRQRAHCL
jgi:tetrahydrodipicolinate N-succinyltransferase